MRLYFLCNGNPYSGKVALLYWDSPQLILYSFSPQINLHNRTFSTKYTGEMVSVDHYGDVIMGMIASQITSLAIVYSTVYSDADQRKHQSSASLAFVRGIHWGPVNSPHQWPVTWKMFPFDDVIMLFCYLIDKRQNSCHFEDDIFKYIFLIENLFIFIREFFFQWSN